MANYKKQWKQASKDMDKFVSSLDKALDRLEKQEKKKSKKKKSR